jgi:UDP-glucuronate decarboxylase
MNTPDDVIGPINLGNSQEFTILELATKVIELINSKSEIVFKPLPADDPKQRKPDISLARQVLGWEPKVSLEKGLIKTITFFEELLRSSSRH